VVLHDFSDGVLGLWKRFVRYGRGNGALERVAGLTMKPRWSRPRQQGLNNLWFKAVQHAALCYGYYTARRHSNGLAGRLSG
jgi:hypothetical protein